MTLTSDPPLEESDILSLIVFNRPVNELGTGERSSLAATAGGIATGFIAAPLGESIGKALDLDLFEISTTTETGDLGAAITLRPAVERADVHQAVSAVRAADDDGVPAGVPARTVPARSKPAWRPRPTGSANRINQRRIERDGDRSHLLLQLFCRFELILLNRWFTSTIQLTVSAMFPAMRLRPVRR